MQAYIVCYSNISIQAGLIRSFFARLAQIDFRFIRFQSIRFPCIGIQWNSFGRQRFCQRTLFPPSPADVLTERAHELLITPSESNCATIPWKKCTQPCVCAISSKMVCWCGVAWSLFGMQTLQTLRWWGILDREKKDAIFTTIEFAWQGKIIVYRQKNVRSGLSSMNWAIIFRKRIQSIGAFHG